MQTHGNQNVSTARHSVHCGMSREFYERTGKAQLLANPVAYAWNCVLIYIQFTQAELLSVKNYLDIPALVKYQTCVTRAWLHEHFETDIEECHHIGWGQINFYVKE